MKIENKRQNQDADKKRVRNGGNEDERDQQNDLAQTGQQQADLGLTQRHKALLAGDLEAYYICFKEKRRN